MLPPRHQKKEFISCEIKITGLPQGNGEQKECQNNS